MTNLSVKVKALNNFFNVVAKTFQIFFKIANKISGLFDAAVYSERNVHLEVL